MTRPNVKAIFLAGLGDDKTDIVVFAEYYDRAPLFPAIVISPALRILQDLAERIIAT